MIDYEAQIGEQSKPEPVSEPQLLVEFDRKTRWVKVGVWRFSADALSTITDGLIGAPDDFSCTLVLKNGFHIRVGCSADLFYQQFVGAFS